MAGKTSEMGTASATGHGSESDVRALAVEQFGAPVIITDTKGRIEYVNSAFERATGYSKGEVIGETPRILTSGRHDDEYYRQMWGALIGGEEWLSRVVNKRKDGVEYTAECRISPVRDEAGRITHFVQIQRDVTKEVELEVALRASEAQYRTLVEKALVGVYCIQDGRYTYVNARFAEMLAYSPEELLAMPSVLAVVAPDDRATVAENLRKRVSGELSHVHYRARALRKDGRSIDIEILGSRTSVNGRAAVIGTVLDLTEARSLQQQLFQSQKMEAVGRLAGGVAHDFNNLLSAILSYSDLLLGTLANDDARKDDVEEIKRAARRAADLSRQLLAFSRKQILEPRVVDLNAIVDNAARMLTRIIGEDIGLVTVLSRPLAKVLVDPAQMEQVILNLAVNSRDAMPDGGKLTIETSTSVLDEEYTCHHPEVLPGRYVMLAVSDTGVGMSPEITRHIFEPFFTTKEKGRGTGLGLSTVYGIVKQSGGSIFVYSEPGKGATFKVYLPIVEPQANVLDDVPPSVDAGGGTETILVAEDDPVLRGLVKRILSVSGYTVLTADHATDALSLCREYPGTIHMLLTDVVMPAMSGRQLADELLKIRPNLRILYVSGYTDNAIVHHGVLDEGIAFLQKPLTPSSLRTKIRQVLDAPSLRPPE